MYVYVFERADFSVSFLAFRIYPETVRRALHQAPLDDQLTGKFTMLVRYDDDGQQVFEVNVEMAATEVATPSLLSDTAHRIIEQLLHDSAEYRKSGKAS